MERRDIKSFTLTELETALYGLEQGTYDLRSVIDLAARQAAIPVDA